MRTNPWEKLVKYHQDHELVRCFFPMSIAIMLSLGSLRGSYWHHHERSHSSNWGNVYTLKALRAHFYTFRERLIIHYQTTAESKPPTSWQSLPVRLDICFAALDTKLGRNQQTNGQYSFLLPLKRAVFEHFIVVHVTSIARVPHVPLVVAVVVVGPHHVELLPLLQVNLLLGDSAHFLGPGI